MSLTPDEIIAALSDPTVYPHTADSVKVIQTHISIVFLAGDYVYKVKKPVNFGFLDFTTLEKRKFFCNQEVALNSRFSSGVYLSVASIFMGPRGINFAGEGLEIEAAVVMRHVPQENLMISMLDHDQVTPRILERVADQLVYFHSIAATDAHISSFGSPRVIYHNLTENFDQTKSFIGRTISGELHAAISERSLDFLKTNEDLFQERMAAGYIRDCHGDLHLDHILIQDRVMLLDCIEFNDRFRYGDTASDLSFLLMDLDFRGFPSFADAIARRYAETSNDRDILTLADFYKSYRAFVRAKVAGFLLDEPEAPANEKESAIKTARRYFGLSSSYLLPPPPPALIALHGFSGTGKSFVGRRLGERLNITPILSDTIRKELEGLDLTQHRLDKFGEGIYKSSSTEKTYSTLFERAEAQLAEGRTVILDATFGKREYRDRARRMAQKHGCEFKVVECVADDDIVATRLEQRLRLPDEPSDGRWEIYVAQKNSFDPISREERQYTVTFSMTDSLSVFLQELVHDLMFPAAAKQIII